LLPFCIWLLAYGIDGGAFDSVVGGLFILLGLNKRGAAPAAVVDNGGAALNDVDVNGGGGGCCDNDGSSGGVGLLLFCWNMFDGFTVVDGGAVNGALDWGGKFGSCWLNCENICDCGCGCWADGGLFIVAGLLAVDDWKKLFNVGCCCCCVGGCWGGSIVDAPASGGETAVPDNDWFSEDAFDDDSDWLSRFDCDVCVEGGGAGGGGLLKKPAAEVGCWPLLLMMGAVWGGSWLAK
jgi:hypothetical protein